MNILTDDITVKKKMEIYARRKSMRFVTRS